MKNKIVKRTFVVENLRTFSEGEKRKIVGHAAVFNILTDNLWGFREKINPGAFTKTINEADIRALFNHDPNFVLGRNRSGTLKLHEDNIGLAIEIDPPDTAWANDLAISIDRGDISQMSFAFRAIKDEVEGKDDEIVRTILEAELFDVSPVTYPAYPETDVSLRELRIKLGLEPDQAVHSKPKLIKILRQRLKLRS